MAIGRSILLQPTDKFRANLGRRKPSQTSEHRSAMERNLVEKSHIHHSSGRSQW
jgi:hypothetical protein